MRIAFDSLVLTTQRYGGVSRYIVSLANSLVKNGHEVEILGKYHINEYLAQYESNFGGNLTKIKKFPPKTRRITQIGNDLVGYLKARKSPPDVFHESFHHTRAIVPSRIPKVVTVHDMIYEVMREQFPQHARSTKIKKKSVDRSDHVICISEQTKMDLIEHFGVSDDKISVIYHGSEWLQDSELDLLSKEEVKESCPYFLYVGARGGYKNFKTLLRAFSKGKFYRDFELVCFGGGTLSSSESELIAQLGIPPTRVRVTSGSDLDLARLYRGAQALVYPSGYEGFGMPPLEAMTMNCPVVASNQAPMPEIIGDAALFFDWKDSQSLTQCLEDVTDDVVARNLIMKGTQRAKHYSWDRCAQQTLAAYRRLVS